MNKLCVLIMAGGKGTRFWPKSTEDKPKQFLNLVGNRTMIQETFERVNKKVISSQIFVVTCEKYKGLVQEQLKNIDEKNIIIEPEGRNTAPCILLSSLYINQMYPNANIVVLPSDHIISNTEQLLDTFDTANEFLNNNDEAIITIGIKPDRPETGYGYIKMTDNKIHLNEMDVLKVEKFVEKPNLETAQKYLDEGNYLWNAGMFVFNVNHMLEELKNNFNSGYELLKDMPSIESPEYKEFINNEYKKCESISIDYAVMEKSQNVYVIPSEFGWDDIGTWKALQRYLKPDIADNIVKGEVEAYDSYNNVVYAGDKKVILLDVDSIFLIESDNFIIVGKKEKIANVHELRKNYIDNSNK